MNCEEGESADWGRLGGMGESPKHSLGDERVGPFPNRNGGHSTRLMDTALVVKPFVRDNDGLNRVGRLRLRLQLSSKARAIYLILELTLVHSLASLALLGNLESYPLSMEYRLLCSYLLRVFRAVWRPQKGPYVAEERSPWNRFRVPVTMTVEEGSSSILYFPSMDCSMTGCLYLTSSTECTKQIRRKKSSSGCR